MVHHISLRADAGGGTNLTPIKTQMCSWTLIRVLTNLLRCYIQRFSIPVLTILQSEESPSRPLIKTPSKGFSPTSRTAECFALFGFGANKKIIVENRSNQVKSANQLKSTYLHTHLHTHTHTQYKPSTKPLYESPRLKFHNPKESAQKPSPNEDDRIRPRNSGAGFHTACDR